MTRKLIGFLALAAAMPLLQGCFPLAVTGAGAAVLMVDDRRTAGIYIEDENIEWKALARIRDVARTAHVNATSYNRKVLLTGECASEEEKKRIEDAVRETSSVRDVANELQVAGASSLASRGSDALITSNVKARLVNNGKVSPNHVKVVTEAGVVYLMGIVTEQEAADAVEVARNTGGVVKVVRIFDLCKAGDGVCPAK